MAFKLSITTRAILAQYGLTDAQVAEVEAVEEAARSLVRSVRQVSPAARLRRMAKELDKAKRRRV